MWSLCLLVLKKVCIVSLPVSPNEIDVVSLPASFHEVSIAFLSVSHTEVGVAHHSSKLEKRSLLLFFSHKLKMTFRFGLNV